MKETLKAIKLGICPVCKCKWDLENNKCPSCNSSITITENQIKLNIPHEGTILLKKDVYEKE